MSPSAWLPNYRFTAESRMKPKLRMRNTLRASVRVARHLVLVTCIADVTALQAAYGNQSVTQDDTRVLICIYRRSRHK